MDEWEDCGIFEVTGELGREVVLATWHSQCHVVGILFMNTKNLAVECYKIFAACLARAS